jgi:hypothetical protein
MLKYVTRHTRDNGLLRNLLLLLKDVSLSVKDSIKFKIPLSNFTVTNTKNSCIK